MKSILLLLPLVITSCYDSEDNKLALKKLEAMRSYQGQYENTYRDIKSGKIKYGQGLYQAMNEIGVGNDKSLGIINALRDEVEFSKLQVGDELTASFNHQNVLVGFSFSQNPAQKHVLKLENHEWIYQFVEEETIWRPRLIEGKLGAGSILQADLKSEGLSSALAGNIIDILLCKINFRYDAREGDIYKVFLNERWYDGKVIERKILYTSYDGPRTGHHEAFFYEEEDKSTFTAHYTADGEALIRSGLRYPVNRLHIRSSYGKRVHPVTGRVAMHRGVDFRGRIGTPVYAVANGRVIESTRTKLGGNKIAIRHADNSVSYYLHLNKRFVKKGAIVKSHQQIGQVGKTGRVTGPHLHFGFKNSKGRWMNPMHKRMIATPKLKGDKFIALQEQIKYTKKLMQDTHNRLSEVRAPAQKNRI